MRKLAFYCLTHLGDAVMDSIILNRLNADIEYFTHPNNIEHVREWFLPHVKLTQYMPGGTALDLWIMHTLRGTWNHPKGIMPHPTPNIYNQVYFDHWVKVCEKIGEPMPFASKEDICHVRPELDQPGEQWDWLYINSEGFSGQVPYDELRLAKIAKRMPGRVITTHPVDGLPCTRQIAPTLFNIGQLAGRCRFIVGINTGPFCAALTKYSLDRMERMVVLDSSHGFDYRGKTVKCRNMEEFESAIEATASYF